MACKAPGLSSPNMWPGTHQVSFYLHLPEVQAGPLMQSAEQRLHHCSSIGLSHHHPCLQWTHKDFGMQGWGAGSKPGKSGADKLPWAATWVCAFPPESASLPSGCEQGLWLSMGAAFRVFCSLPLGFDLQVQAALTSAHPVRSSCRYLQLPPHGPLH